jgi:hypothetical protein
VIWLLGCAARTPPVLFPAAAVPMTEPEPVAWETAPDECATGQALKPGSAPPYVELLAGKPVAICRAQVVPETRFVELLAAEEEAIYWRELAATCSEARDRDRLYAQQIYDETWRAGTQASRDLRAQRWSTGGALVLGFAVGVGTTYAVTKVAVDALE